ncbi:hypothetical protein F4778DRAFT_508984 [Xylariomycetidae sp. FL2044]|nr:hypothetical protein F4778DRAFT_508984 [Xylariomycetidae sp. FL2044]
MNPYSRRPMSASEQSRPALGQVADIGSFYDASRDAFLPSRVINRRSAATALRSAICRTHRSLMTRNDDWQSKFDAFHINPELGGSFVAGLVPVSGAAQYLRMERAGSDFVEGALILETTTDEQTVDIAALHQHGMIPAAAFQTRDATHFVARITYGAITVIAARKAVEADRNQAMSRLLLKLRILADYVRQVRRAPVFRTNSNDDFDIHQHDLVHTALHDISLRTFSDVEALHDLRAIDTEDVIQLLKQFGSISSRRSVPIMYELIPLSYLRTGLGRRSRIIAIPSTTLNVLAQLFDAWQAAEGEIRAHLRDTGQYIASGYTSNDIRKKLGSVSLKVQHYKDEYRRLLVDVRLSQRETNDLNRLIQKCYTSDFAPKKVASMLAKAQRNSEFQSAIERHGGVYLDYSGAQKAVLTGNHTYILYFTDEMREDRETWVANEQIIMNLLKRNSGDYFVAAAQCHPDQLTFKKPRITLYRRGEVSISDMLGKMDLADQCFARYDHKQLDDNVGHHSVDRRLVRIPCPGLSCDQEQPCDWTCYRCRAPLEYHEQFIYCDCGRVPPKAFSWQCNAEDHGNSFVPYNTDKLDGYLKALHSYKELNILLLGETGVGKSTFINALYNYMQFETLDEALNHEQLQYMIPSSFSMQYIDETTDEGAFVQRDVKVGADDNEHDGSHGDSATQRPNVYKIHFGDTLIRLIDTPGIGDVRGVDQDARNLTNILRTLNRFPKLDGVVILLKPNTARLTLMFRFCVKELLSSLHRDAARNIVWGFTNTRQSNYMPGDAYKPLERLLRQHESLGLKLNSKCVFCFDSESFRCLAAKKQIGIDIPNMDDFRRSWERSVKETKRLLEHFSSIEPHQVKSTISLNRAREVIAQLTQPMAAITDTIARTISLNKDKMAELNSVTCKGKDLKENLHFERIEIEVEALDHPRTVCKHTECVEIKNIAGVRRPLYKSICHEGCHLKNVQEETIGHRKLMRCRAFRDGKSKSEVCMKCGHHWQQHMHIRYSQKESVVRAIDPVIQQKIADNVSDVQLQKAAVRSMKKDIDGCESELKEIQDAAIHFGLFLKKNSIAPYNDAMIAYLDEMIKEERQLVEHARQNNIPVEKNEERLRNLERGKKAYAERIKFLEKSMETTNDVQLLDEQGVDDLVNKLYGLKEWGKNLQKMGEMVDWSQANDVEEQEYRPKVHRLWNVPKWMLSRAASVARTAKVMVTGKRQQDNGRNTSPSDSSVTLSQNRKRTASVFSETSEPEGYLTSSKMRKLDDRQGPLRW